MAEISKVSDPRNGDLAAANEFICRLAQGGIQGSVRHRPVFRLRLCANLAGFLINDAIYIGKKTADHDMSEL